MKSYRRLVNLDYAVDLANKVKAAQEANST